MKKVFLVTILVLTFIFISPKKIFAACNPDTSGVGQCPRGQITCGLNGSVYCCAQLAGGNSCSQVPGSIQATIPPVNIGGAGSGAGSGGSSTSVLCGNGINTAIGCIPVLENDNGTAFAGFVLRWAIGVGSGIAFLLIVYASFMTMTSQGDPNRLKAGSELMTSAISGLLLLIFSIFVLKFIGVDILGLDTWGFGK